MRFVYTVIALSFFATLYGQDAELASDKAITEIDESAEPVIESVPLNLVNQSWFTDRIGMAVVYFDAEVDALATLPRGIKGLSFLDIEVQAIPDSNKGKSVANLRFVLRETGLVTIPSIEFIAGERIYHTMPAQILVGEPVPSETMSLSLIPHKRRIYVGEPLRLDFIWRCEFDAGRLQALNYYPPFFNDTSVEVVIPRNTSAEAKQVGLPIGGRRVIADRSLSPDKPKSLGRVELPLFLRWDKPGTYHIPATHLECARLLESSRNFGQYAAHFNNELFAAEDPRLRYERYYAESEPIEIEVLPLPEEGRSSRFSGWFAPTRVHISVTPTELEPGQLMEVTIQVSSQAPHGMIDLPPLRLQPKLRGRFLEDPQVARIWRADGTTFNARVRALSVGVDAFPSIEFQVFNPETARYEILTTDPVPLTVKAGDGASMIDISAYAGAQVSLIEQPEGIWHNLEVNWMDDLMNTVVVMLAEWFWLFLVMGPLAYVCLLPWVRERRRRATDPDYLARLDAYRAFQKCPDTSPEKWSAFLRFMAVSFQSNQAAWTVGDSRRALKSVGASEADIERVAALHASMDLKDFSVEQDPMPPVDFSGIGQRIFRLINQCILVLVLLSLLSFATDAEATTWAEAEGWFDQAMSAQAGSDAASALFAESALKFQAVAEAGERPGAAWYNAGNAWFKTGALGRSIAAYRQAKALRPFDQRIDANLSAARQLTLTDVPPLNAGLMLPTIWLKAVVVICSLAFWFGLLLFLRYRKRILLVVAIALGLTGLGMITVWAIGQTQSLQQGVVIVDEVIARKGPGYAYAQAFDQPLQDGLEFHILESRGEWSLIEFEDDRQCWIPTSQLQFIRD